MPGCTRLRNYQALVRDHGCHRRLKEHMRSQLTKNHLVNGIKDGASVDETLTAHWFDLIDKMLILDPSKRLTAT